VLHAPPILLFLIWSREQYFARSTNNEASYYVVFPTLLLLCPLRPKYLPQLPVLNHLQPMFLPQSEIPRFTPIQNTFAYMAWTGKTLALVSSKETHGVYFELLYQCSYMLTSSTQTIISVCWWVLRCCSLCQLFVSCSKREIVSEN
jgi:hypothetical protein